MCVKQSHGYIIYRGSDPREESGGMIGLRYPQNQISYRNELHRVPTRVWPGTRREYVSPACTSSLGVGTYVGGCERDGFCETEAMCR